ncbi:MAG: hypothetical protein JXR96_16255 [Deltaproteobacteria bacterium]|nr:hypothetical protein [Deltaproteobacteria bacterium]
MTSSPTRRGTSDNDFRRAAMQANQTLEREQASRLRREILIQYVEMLLSRQNVAPGRQV